ncbi:MAG: hypothetical protein AAFX10_16840, partial [Pseudomonadota bacterium]
HDDADLHALGRPAIDEIGEWEARITQLKHETYEDEDAWATMFDGQLRYLLDTIDDSGAPVTEGMRIRQADLFRQWEALEAEVRGISERYIAPINDWARERRQPYVVSPGAAGA